MSDEADDLLVRGIAAARAHDADEARFYLEWVLRTDADFDQQSDAWYWLSYVSKDPAEKREYLQNVLAIYPNYPEARRDLAILDGRLDPRDVLSETRRDLGPLVPGEPTGDEIHRFECPRCGGRTIYEPGRGVVACQFCGYRPDEKSQVEPSAPATSLPGSPNQDWIAAIYTEKGHRWELPASRSFICEGCGARMTLEPSRVSGSCPFCGSPYVVRADDGEELIQPDGILPFALSAQQALARCRDWIAASKYRPADLDEQAQFQPPRPVYMPAWVFNIGGEAHWKGFVVNQEYGRTTLTPTDGTMAIMLDDQVVPGSKSKGSEELPYLRFNLHGLLPYDESLLADWPAEIYSVSLGDAGVAAHERAFKEGQRQALRDAQALIDVSTVEVDRVDISILSFRHVLLPTWICDYSYAGRNYTLVTDGNGGDVRGQVPRSGVQRFLEGMLGKD